MLIKIFCIFLSLQISALMDKFENQFETLDVQTAQMEDTMTNTTTLTTPQVISTVLQRKLLLRLLTKVDPVIIETLNPLKTYIWNYCLLGWSLEWSGYAVAWDGWRSRVSMAHIFKQFENTNSTLMTTAKALIQEKHKCRELKDIRYLPVKID